MRRPNVPEISRRDFLAASAAALAGTAVVRAAAAVSSLKDAFKGRFLIGTALDFRTPVPELPAQNALEVLGDLYGTLDDKTADALTKALRRSRKGKGKSLGNLRNPWRT